MKSFKPFGRNRVEGNKQIVVEAYGRDNRAHTSDFRSRLERSCQDNQYIDIRVLVGSASGV